MLGTVPAIVNSLDFTVAFSGCWALKPPDLFMSPCPLQLVASSRIVINLTLPFSFWFHCGLTGTVGK